MPAVITAVQRWELARMFERAKQLALAQPPDFRGAHAVLAECCTIDPGNTLFVQALLENLQRAQGRTARAWPWQIWSIRADFQRALTGRDVSGALGHGWRLLAFKPKDDRLISHLAELCHELGHGQSQVLLLQEACRVAPRNAMHLPFLAIALGEQGQFASAADTWREWLRHSPDDKNAKQLIEIYRKGNEAPDSVKGDLPTRVKSLIEHGHWFAAEQLLAEESGAEGNDLRLREFGEEISLRRAAAKTEMAERQFALMGTPRTKQLVSEVQDEQRRIELGVAFARYERFPSEPASSWELARCLSRVGNYSESLKYLAPLLERPDWKLRSLVAVAENWQQLRQFEKALGFYREAVTVADQDGSTEDSAMKAWYRGAVLAEAMGRVTEAVGWLERLTAADPGYKDAAARLVKLRAVCDKGGFSAEPAAGQST
jgi:tetratricopeptide (TPR) repeat protein